MTVASSPVGVVVVNFASHELIRANVVPAVDGVDWARVIVVDNFTSAAEADAVGELTRRVGWSVVSSATNIGFGAAVNLGVAEAARLGCSVFLVLNPDVVMTTEVLRALRSAALAEPLALISPTIHGPDGAVWAALGSIDMEVGRVLTSGRPESPAWVSGACVAVHQELWDRVHGFDADYFLYWEDVDLSVRCVAAGGRLMLRDDLIVRHDIGGTQGPRGGKSAAYYYYNVRNRLVFAAKHLPPKDRLRWLTHTTADARRVANRGIPPKFHRLRVAAPAILRGGVAGLAWMVRASARRPGRERVVGVTMSDHRRVAS